MIEWSTADRPKIVTPKAASRYRRWEDLAAWRLFLGLVLGPVLLAALLAIFGLLDPRARADHFVLGVIGVLLFGVIWMLVAGWSYLLTVVRWRRRIARVECMVLGVALNEFLSITLVASGVMHRSGGLTQRGVAAVVAAAIVMVPIGLLAGWLFWRFGVRPAAAPVADAAVFD